MTAPDTSYDVRALTEDDWADFVDVDSHAFGVTMDAEVVDAERELHEPGRDIGAYDGTQLAGIATAYSFDLTVPGAVVPAAGVSWVGVSPTHRRRGVLRALMTYQLHDVHQRGREPLAILWASEPPIYGRFGYGLASAALRMKVPRSAQALRRDAPHDPSLRLRLVPATDWKLTADVYDAVARTRPGMLRRDERWHRRSVLDLPSNRRGRSELRCVVAEDNRGVRGYARYATKADWSPDGPKGTVEVREVIAVDAGARAALFRFLCDLDLMSSTELWNQPVDDPLMHWLDNPRITQPVLLDALYVRLVDLASALTQRTYATPVEVVLGVTDQLCRWNDGRWRLTGGPAGARCEPTDGPADVTLSVTDLGAVYLGGTDLRDLAQAARVVEGRPGAVSAAAAAFATSPRPWCPIVF